MISGVNRITLSIGDVDPDGHKLEIHASDLETRLRSAKEQPWEGLEFFI